MDPRDRYRLDTLGYLHIRGALSPEELGAARAAVDDYIAAADAAHSGAGPPLPDGFASREQAHYGKYSNGIFWSKALELLLFHRATWPAVLELTGGRPRFTGGTLLVDDWDRGAELFAPGAHLHGVRDRQLNKEGARSPACCCEPRSDGTMRCNNFVLFPYLDDVLPGDGGVFVLPGSHKALVTRPGDLFGEYGADARAAAGPGTDRAAEERAKAGTEQQRRQTLAQLPLEVPDGCAKPAFDAGDMLLMPEATLHGVMPWTAAGRRRRTFILRYTEDGTAWNGKNSVAADDFLSLAPPPPWTSRLSAPTLMLMGHQPPQSLAGMSAAEIAGVVRGGGARL